MQKCHYIGQLIKRHFLVNAIQLDISHHSGPYTIHLSKNAVCSMNIQRIIEMWYIKLYVQTEVQLFLFMPEEE